MSLLVETVGFFLAVVGWAMLAITLFNSYWRVSTVSGNVITTSTIFENLWQSCATDSTGVYNCWEFQSLLELPAYLQASRALMISALVLGFLGILCGMIGLQCTKVAEDNPNMKSKMAALSGFMFVLAGLCGMVTVSWYAANITRDFFNPLFVGTKIVSIKPQDGMKLDPPSTWAGAHHCWLLLGAHVCSVHAGHIHHGKRAMHTHTKEPRAPCPPV
uniref:Claudin n=1 Tax=Pogona vitticeps TaxID=103695 RepID=A0ABM5EIV1_9SAUR